VTARDVKAVEMKDLVVDRCRRVGDIGPAACYDDHRRDSAL